MMALDQNKRQEVEALIKKEDQLIKDLVTLFKEKTPFNQWPYDRYYLFWHALYDLDDKMDLSPGECIEKDKARNLKYWIGIQENTEKLAEPGELFRDTDQSMSDHAQRSIERIRADLARLIPFKKGVSHLQ